MKHLFIGGPFDGQWKAVDSNRPYVIIADLPKFSAAEFLSSMAITQRSLVDRHTYEQFPLSVEGTRFVIFKHESLTNVEVLTLLIEGYRQP